MTRSLIVCMIMWFVVFPSPVDAGQTVLEKLMPEDLILQGWKTENKPLTVSDEVALSMVIPRFTTTGAF